MNARATRGGATAVAVAAAGAALWFGSRSSVNGTTSAADRARDDSGPRAPSGSVAAPSLPETMRRDPAQLGEGSKLEEPRTYAVRTSVLGPASAAALTPSRERW